MTARVRFREEQGYLSPVRIFLPCESFGGSIPRISATVGATSTLLMSCRVNVLQTFSLEVRAGGVKDGLHLRQPRIMAMLTEKRRRLKEVAYGCPCARVEVQVITGDCNHQDIPGVVAESMKVPFSAAPLLLLIASEIRCFD